MAVLLFAASALAGCGGGGGDGTSSTAPVAKNGTLVTNEDTIGSDELVATDVDSPSLSYSTVNLPGNGTLTSFDQNTGAYSYTPNPDVSGSDSFTFKANDGSLDSNIATISITINPVNDTPIAAVDDFTVDEGSISTTLDLAANDSDVDNALNLDSIAITSGPGNGSLVVNNDGTGTVYYTHDGSETTGDSFTYTIDDQSGATSNIEVVNLTITPVNDPPVAIGSCGTTPQALTLNGTLGATDPDISEILTYGLGADGLDGAGPLFTTKNGMVTLNTTTGDYTYTPAPGAAGNMRGLDSFDYRVTDLDGAFSSDTQTVIVDQKIMPLGDSITMGEMWVGPTAGDYLAPDGDIIGYRESLYDSLNGADYTFDFVGSQLHGNNLFSDFQHEGHPAWTALDVAFGQTGYPTDGVQAWLDSNPADIILLHAGTNDLANTNENHIAAILDEIDTWEANKSNPITVLLAMIIDQNPIEPDVATFNTAVFNMVQLRAGDNIIIVDQHGALTYPDDLSENIAVTGFALHPNVGGYTKMADTWFTALGAVVDKCP